MIAPRSHEEHEELTTEHTEHTELEGKGPEGARPEGERVLEEERVLEGNDRVDRIDRVDDGIESLDGLVIDISGVAGVPNLTQYFGVWAMEPGVFRGVLQTVRGVDLAAHAVRHAEIRAASGGASPGFGSYEIVNGVAVIDVEGTLTKKGSSLADMPYGVMGARESLRRAMSNPSVLGIAIRIDSPGGNAAGIGDLGRDIARAGEKKPVSAYIEDMGASAAYWLASQAPKVWANDEAVIGSIGAYTVLQDYSAVQERRGVKVHVVRSGRFKGIGAGDTAVTDEQLSEVQRHVNAFHGVFVGAVARGRGLDEEAVRGIADGRVFMAGEALELGLIDGVKSFEQVLEELRRPRPAANHERGQRMSTEATTAVEPRAATLNELKAACQGADSDFLIAQQEANATVSQAQTAWIAKLQQQRETAEKLAASMKAEAEEAKVAAEAASKRPGVKALGAGTGKAPQAETPADSVEAWESAIASEIASGKSKPAAIRSVVASNPELHKAYLEEHNRRNGR